MGGLEEAKSNSSCKCKLTQIQDVSLKKEQFTIFDNMHKMHLFVVGRIQEVSA